jgi:hypothetical protein
MNFVLLMCLVQKIRVLRTGVFGSVFFPLSCNANIQAASEVVASWILREIFGTGCCDFVHEDTI